MSFYWLTAARASVLISCDWVAVLQELICDSMQQVILFLCQNLLILYVAHVELASRRTLVQDCVLFASDLWINQVLEVFLICEDS